MTDAVRRLACVLLAGLALAGRARAQEASPGVTGRVVGPDGVGILGVEVRIVGAGGAVHQTRTDSLGQFALTGPAAADGSARFRRLGYKPAVVRVRGGDRHLLVELATVPTSLSEVTVRARADAGLGGLEEFYAHRERTAFGTFFDPDQIAEKEPRRLSELMRYVPGARLIPGRLGSLVRIRGCRPMLWLNGVRVPGAELDETVSIDDVAAVEVYNSFAGIPAQYVDRGSNCGAIVVWVKS